MSEQFVIHEPGDFFEFQPIQNGIRHVYKDVHALQPGEPGVVESGGYPEQCRHIFNGIVVKHSSVSTLKRVAVINDCDTISNTE